MIMSLKQKKTKFKPRIKFNHNIYAGWVRHRHRSSFKHLKIMRYSPDEKLG